MKRKILSLILVFAMTVSLLTVGTGAVEPTYGDTAGHWAESSIERWSAYGIIQGSNGQFDPNGQLTCAQLATILAKLLKLPAAKDAGFTDNTADAWYYDAVNRCAAAGILNGNGDSTVTPDAPISRERAIVMLGRALGIELIREPDLTKYTDAAKVAPYAQGMVAAMIEAGIVGGVTADELAPQDNINRASTVTILDRAIRTYADQAGATVKADGKGIVLVVADDVTVTGDVDTLLVAAPEANVTLDGATAKNISVNSKDSKLVLNNSEVENVSVSGANTEVETKGSSKVENVSVTEDAKGATVNAGSGTTVKNVENSAADTTVTGSGSVKNVASDTDVTVETKGTEVKNTGDEKITVTDKNGKDSAVNSGSSSTTTGGTTSGGSSSGSSGGSSGGSSTPSHTHVWATEWSHNETNHWHNCTAANCTVSSNEGKKDYAAHIFTYTDNGDGTHTKSCSTCGYSATEAHSYGESGQCACGLPEPAENVLASVKQADGTYVYYTSVQNAINAAGENAIVKLLKNLAVDTQTIVDKEVTLDLAGHTLTSNSQPWVKDNGVLTITDSRDNGEIVLSSAGIMLNEGKLVLNKGKIHALTNSDVVFIMGTGGFTMHGGMLLADAGACIDASYGSGESKIDITGGTVTTKDTGTNAIYIASRFGQGKVIASISGGTFTTGGQPAVCVDDQNSTLSITGGTFSTKPDDSYIAAGYEATDNRDGTWTVGAAASATFAAQVGGVMYTTLADALAAADENAIVKLLENVDGQVVIPAGKKLTLDLNGKTITHSGTAIINNGTLIVKNGAVVSTGNCGIGVGNNSETTILSDVTVTAQESAVITSKSTGASITVMGGTFTSTDNAVIAGNGSERDGEPNTILIKDGTFNGGITSEGFVACGIYAPWKDEITVKGGTFNIRDGAGIVARAGQVSVDGGTFTCTGNATGKVGDSRVVIPCAALVFDSAANYPALNDESVIYVKSGSFTAANGVDVVKKVENKSDLNPRISIEGGSFSSDPSAYVKGGYTAQGEGGIWTVQKSE